MADTSRALAALQTLLADNTTGEISPQDVRDFLLSVHPESALGNIPNLSAPPDSPFTDQAYYDTTLNQLGINTTAGWVYFNSDTPPVSSIPGINLEGASPAITGGAGGTVHTVTNLNDSGAGSFREAINGSNRIVEFAVAGNITSTSTAFWASDNNITIRGETAPAPGICLRVNNLAKDHSALVLTGSNVIVQWLRIRANGKTDPSTSGDGVHMGGVNLALNHCSISWATDENLNSWDNTTGNHVIQWCMIYEGLSPHSMGYLVGGTATGAYMLHHNLMAHNQDRALIRCNATANIDFDARNNVVYNRAQGNLIDNNGSAADHRFNFVNNEEIDGAENPTVDMVDVGNMGTGTMELYGSGNVAANNDFLDTGDVTTFGVDTPWPVAAITTASLAQNKSDLLQYAGASFRLASGVWVAARDSADQRIADDVTNVTGTAISAISEVGGYPF